MGFIKTLGEGFNGRNRRQEGYRRTWHPTDAWVHGCLKKEAAVDVEVVWMDCCKTEVAAAAVEITKWLPNQA